MKSKTINLLIAISSLLFLLIGYFIAYLNFPSEQAWVSNIFIVLMASPAFYFFLKPYTKRKALTLISLFIFAVLFEAQAILTGFPYSEFHYSEKIPGKLFGIVPLSVGFAWTPLLLGAAYVFQKYKNNFLKFTIFTALFLVLIDLVLDPGATAAELWIWQTNNGFYGVPLVNFVGWLVSGFIGATIYYFGLKNKNTILNPLILLSLIFTLTFWTGVAIFHSLHIAVILGLLLIGLLHYKLNLELPNYKPEQNKSN